MHVKAVIHQLIVGICIVAIFSIWAMGRAAEASSPETNSPARLQAGAGPGGFLTESDLPGFRPATPPEVAGWYALAWRLTACLPGGSLDTPTRLAVFTHTGPFRTEVALAFVLGPLAEADAAGFDALARQPQPALAALEETARSSGASLLPALSPAAEGIGEASLSISFGMGAEPVAQEVSLIWARRGQYLQSTWVVHPAGEAPSIAVETLAALVDARLREQFPGITYRPASTYVPDLTTHIPTPLDLSGQPAVIGTNLLLAALVMLPFAVAAETFTRLMGQREQALRERGHLPSTLRRWFDRLQGTHRPETGKRGLPENILRLVLVMFFYGLTFSLLDRTWRPFTPTGLVLFADMLLAYGLVGIADDILQWRLLKKWGTPVALSVRPSNILLAACSTLCSRLIPLIPGLMFGTPEALVVDETRLTRQKRNRLLAVSALTLLVLGLGLWALTALTSLLQRGMLTGFWAGFVPALEAFLLVIFAVALENTFVQMIGLPGSVGEALRRNSTPLWLVGLAGVTFLFYHTLINPRGDLAEAVQGSNIWILLVAAGVFMLATFTWWLIDRFRSGKHPAAKEVRVTSHVHRTLPAWAWLVAITLVLMAAGTLLLSLGGEAPAPLQDADPATGATPRAQADAAPLEQQPTHPLPFYGPPTLVGRVCFLPEYRPEHATYDAAIWNSTRLAAAQFGGQAEQAMPEEASGESPAEAINRFMREGCDLIVGTFNQENALLAAAKDNPEQRFWVWGGNSGTDILPNYWRAESSIAQGTYLAGYMAAGASSSGKVGIFGGEDFPDSRMFMDCFARGVDAYIDAHQFGAEVLGWIPFTQQGLFAGSFSSPEQGAFIASQLIDQGVDVLLPVAGSGPGSTGHGAAEAVLEHEGVDLIGIELDWGWAYPEFSQVLLTSVEIRFDEGIANALLAMVEGGFTGGAHAGTLASGEIRLSPHGPEAAPLPTGLVEELEELARTIPTFGCPERDLPEGESNSPAPTLFTLPTFTGQHSATPRPTNTPDKGIFNPENGHWYRLFPYLGGSIHTMNLSCSQKGAHLVTISDASENEFVYIMSPGAVLGATDEDVEGQWVWVTGEPFSYTNWDEGEPNNCGDPGCSVENYLQFSDTPGTWNDVPDACCDLICEWDQ